DINKLHFYVFHQKMYINRVFYEFQRLSVTADAANSFLFMQQSLGILFHATSSFFSIIYRGHFT
ncbi:MAG: hypothetical protein PVG30_09360, partial [Gammaproteobacteria bacterium]